MTRLTRLEKNCLTGEETIIELTDEEIAVIDKMTQEAEVEKSKWVAEQEKLAILKESAKSKLIAGEPLTEEEAAIIVL